MGRPRLAFDEIRENFTVRLSAAEREQIEEKAHLLNLTPSDYARACLLQGTVKIVREEGHDPEKVRALLAIGNNLNQMARRRSTGGVPPWRENRFRPAKTYLAIQPHKPPAQCTEPPRVSRRLRPLREWSHEEIREVFP